MALELLSEMPLVKIEPSEVSFSAGISACQKGGQWQMALHLLSWMLLDLMLNQSQMLAGSPYRNFGVYVYALKLHGALRSSFASLMWYFFNGPGTSESDP